MGYWLVTKLKFVTNQTSYITEAKQPIGNILNAAILLLRHKFKVLALRNLGEIMLEAEEILYAYIMH